jgi:hypothetical protein
MNHYIPILNNLFKIVHLFNCKDVNQIKKQIFNYKKQQNNYKIKRDKYFY